MRFIHVLIHTHCTEVLQAAGPDDHVGGDREQAQAKVVKTS